MPLCHHSSNGVSRSGVLRFCLVYSSLSKGNAGLVLERDQPAQSLLEQRHEVLRECDPGQRTSPYEQRRLARRGEERSPL